MCRVYGEFMDDFTITRLFKIKQPSTEISYILKSGISRDADNWILFIFAILSATLFLIHIAFLTLFKHNFTIFSTHSETYINSLQKHMLIFFGKHFEVRPQLIIRSSKICFYTKIKDTLLFQT